MKAPLFECLSLQAKGNLRLLVIVLLFLVLEVLEAKNEEPALEDFDLFSLEELINIKVTSVSKREQSLKETAAAIFVLSNEDIRRSGALSLPDALRQVPGMEVGAVNSSQWAVSARGFNNIYANKLLVLIDGRAVYNPLFSGVYWDLQRPMLEDLDRIEVIRGSGTTIWGANAVNGVINIVSKSARDTQGGLLYSGGGDVYRLIGGARYGGVIDSDTYYRVFAGYESKGNYQLSDGTSAEDSWEGGFGGFRLDRYLDSDTELTWQGDLTTNSLDDGRTYAYNVNTLGRWSRRWSDRDRLEMQIYYDHTHRDEFMRAHATINTVDLTMDHSFGWGESHDLIWGWGYRYHEVRLESTPNLVSTEGDAHLDLFSVFVQDEYRIIPDHLVLTGGVKVEHNDFTGFEVQPSVRLVFEPNEKNVVWAAISRSVRTPALVEGNGGFEVVAENQFIGQNNSFDMLKFYGNSKLDSGVLYAYELGYRFQPHRRVNVDLATFINYYDDLITSRNLVDNIPGNSGSPRIAVFSFANAIEMMTYGGEAVVEAVVTDNWNLRFSYAYLDTHLHSGGGVLIEAITDSAATTKMTLSSSHALTSRLRLDLQLRYLSEYYEVPAYVTGDIRIAYQWNDQLEFILVGQNLFDDHHPEQADIILVKTAEVPRGVYGKITWHF